MKTITKVQSFKIAEVLAYAKQMQYEFVTTYDGGTFPLVVSISDIVVSKTGQFVTIIGEEKAKTSFCTYQYITKERFNLNDNDFFSATGAKAFNHAINTILKAYRNHK
jgi:hypothetical protein